MSAAVYRRRRLVVGAVALLALLLAGIALGTLISRGLSGGEGDAAPSSPAPAAGEPAPSADASGGGSAPPASSPAPSPSAEPAPAPTPTVTAPPFPDPALADVPQCQPSDLRLVAATDAGEYRAGEGEALLRLGITNLSSTDCRLDVGTAQQEFRVRGPGEAEVFTTRTCQQTPIHQEMRLTPHREQSAVYRWDVRTAPAACGQQGAPPAPGAHTLTVSLGDLTSRPVAFRVLESAASSAAASAAAASSPQATATGPSSAPATPAPGASTGPAAKATATPSPTPTR